MAFLTLTIPVLPPRATAARFTPSLTCSGTWNVVKSPNPAKGADYLWDVDSISESDSWAVGEAATAQSILLTLAEHWDGHAWTVIPTPNPGSSQNILFGVGARSSDDVWAAGYYQQRVKSSTLIEHWDGLFWHVVPSPSPAHLSSSLNDVVALAADDAWAVGSTLSQSSQYKQGSLIEHWDGTRWSIVPSPSPQPGNELLGATAIASDDVWAVGLMGEELSEATLVEHWDGTAWSVVPSPNPAPITNWLTAVAANSATDIWTVGYYVTNTEPGRQQTLTEHWDGTAWSIVPGPDVGLDLAQLWGVATGPRGDVWAVGVRPDPTLLGELTLTEHYC